MNTLLSQFSLFFIYRWRFTVLMLIGVLVLGTLSYTTFLQKEGFPSVQPPVATLNVQYAVDDAQTVNDTITTPLEEATGDIPELNTISSTTRANGTTLTYQFRQTTTGEEGKTLIKNVVETDVTLPEKADLSYNTVNPTAPNGEHETILTLTNDDASLETIQEEAKDLAAELQQYTEVSSAEAIPAFKTRTNPRTGEDTTEQVRFARAGVQRKGELTTSEGVQVGLTRNKQFGTLAFSERVQKGIEQAVTDDIIPSDYRVVTAFDPADTLTEQLTTLQESMLTGLLAVAVIILLLISWRASVVTLLFLPTVMAGTFAGLFLFGIPLNLLTLIGLILVLGLIADDAIIVIDAIDFYRKQGYQGIEAIRAAIQSIGAPDLAGTLTTVLAFVPLLFVSGVLGEFVRLIPVTIILSLSISLAVGLSLIPFLGNAILPQHQPPRNPWLFFPRWLDWLNSKLAGFTRRYIHHPLRLSLLFLVGVGLVSGTAFAYAQQLEFKLFASAKDTNVLVVRANFSSDLTLEDVQDKTRELESRLKDNPNSEYIQHINSLVANKSQVVLRAKLVPMETRPVTSSTMAESLRPILASIEGVDVVVGNGGAGPPVQQYSLSVNVFAEEQETLETVTTDLQDYLENDLKLEEGSITKTNRAHLDTITKKNDRRFASVRIGVSDQGNTGLSQAIQSRVREEFNTSAYRSDYNFSEDDIQVDLGQQGENLKSFESALFALVVAVIAMYLLLVLQFNSFLQPVLILSAIPLSLPGVFMALFYSNNALSFLAFVGITGLVGVVVNNTILLIDAANQHRQEGYAIPEAIQQALSLRFRPLVTTTVTTMAGMLPLGFSAPFWEGLTFSLVFGLLSSTLFVLLLFPVFYIIVENLRRVFWSGVYRILKKR
jgi:multidrug efflux pump subunit AcrB